MVVQFAKNSPLPSFFIPEDSFPCSRNPAIRLYPEPLESSSHTIFLKNHFNVVLTFTQVSQVTSSLQGSFFPFFFTSWRRQSSLFRLNTSISSLPWSSSVSASFGLQVAVKSTSVLFHHSLHPGGLLSFVKYMSADFLFNKKLIGLPAQPTTWRTRVFLFICHYFSACPAEQILKIATPPSA
jgi:hypothetical protein